ncbi:MAG TPA: substrate-binding domain-containing protein [Rhodanobacteraceae bacterium]|nr:substrate-binding domain-containing protein [Rhodanobacteraceae bacterium]
MRQRFRFVFVLLAASFFLCVFATASAAEDELIWRGDHATGRAIMDDLAKQYAKEKKGKITLQPFSTVSGLDAVAQGTADIAGSARGKYLKRPEEAGINFVPVALDAAVMITYPKNPVASLTLKQVYDIYYGRITNWSALGGEPKDINLYGIAAPLDGVEFSVRDLVFRNGDQRVAVPRLYLNTTKLEEGIAIDPAGLGLSTLAGIHANKGVKALAIEGVSATPATIADGSYPLYITLYLAEKVDSPKEAAIERFLAFLNSDSGKAILRKHDLVPYSDAANAQARDATRTAFIDAHLGRGPGTTVAATAPVAAAVPTPTPVSAPRATLESKTRIAPTAESTEQARANLDRANAARQEKKEAATKSESATVVAMTAAPATPASTAKPADAKKKPKTEAKPAKKKAAVARTAKPAKQKAAKPASFDNVGAAATTAAKPASFGDVNAGTASSTSPEKN